MHWLVCICETNLHVTCAQQASCVLFVRCWSLIAFRMLRLVIMHLSWQMQLTNWAKDVAQDEWLAEVPGSSA